MAGIKVSGFEELRAKTENLQKIIADEAIKAAEDAAAQVMKRAIQAASPVGTVSRPATKKREAHTAGQLRSSVKIIRGKPHGLLVGGLATQLERIFVGPEKKKGYYGFFQEKGWVSTGSRRRDRPSTGTTHSQSGVKGGTKIQTKHKDWFKRVVDATHMRAFEAGKKAFEDVLKRNI